MTEPVGYVFECQAPGGCRLRRVFDGRPDLKLPAPAEEAEPVWPFTWPADEPETP